MKEENDDRKLEEASASLKMESIHLDVTLRKTSSPEKRLSVGSKNAVDHIDLVLPHGTVYDFVTITQKIAYDPPATFQYSTFSYNHKESIFLFLLINISQTQL